jgi:hypothetical protein
VHPVAVAARPVVRHAGAVRRVGRGEHNIQPVLAVTISKQLRAAR